MKKFKRLGKEKMAFGLVDLMKNEDEKKHHLGGIRRAALIQMVIPNRPSA
jgi:hypothetical protein